MIIQSPPTCSANIIINVTVLSKQVANDYVVRTGRPDDCIIYQVDGDYVTSEQVGGESRFIRADIYVGRR